RHQQQRPGRPAQHGPALRRAADAGVRALQRDVHRPRRLRRPGGHDPDVLLGAVGRHPAGGPERPRLDRRRRRPPFRDSPGRVHCVEFRGTPSGQTVATLPPTGLTSTAATIGASATGATESVNTVTITTTAAHNFVVGQLVTISGVGVAGYNGTFLIASVPT